MLEVWMFSIMTIILACSAADTRPATAQPEDTGTVSTPPASMHRPPSSWSGGVSVGDDTAEPDTGDTGVQVDTEPGVTDDDGDGYPAEVDCDDTDADVHPGADEVAYNGVDDDCSDSTPDDDLDGDGYDLANDCDDEDPAINPGEAEVYGDGVDNDCDGTEDECDGAAGSIVGSPSTSYSAASGVSGAVNLGQVQVYGAICDWSCDQWWATAVLASDDGCSSAYPLPYGAAGESFRLCVSYGGGAAGSTATCELVTSGGTWAAEVSLY